MPQHDLPMAVSLVWVPKLALAPTSFMHAVLKWVTVFVFLITVKAQGAWVV